MKLLDQYLYAIGKKLPFKGRKEIEMELKSLMLDELEGKYGDSPTDDQIETFIASYGSPREVANRYKSDNLVIGSGYTDIYFMIMKIMVLAMTIAFTVTFVVQLLNGEFETNSSIVIGFLTVPLNIFSACLGAFGGLTLVFIAMTRFNNDQSINIDEDWTPAELKDVKVGPEVESKISSAFAIFFIILFIVVINVLPGLISIGERSFETSGIMLQHYINIDVFRSYLLPLTAVWIGELIYHAFNLYNGPSRTLAFYDLVLEIVSAALIVSIFFDMSLYQDYTGIIGFRSMFGVVGFINVLESFNKTYKFIRYYVLAK